MTDGTTRGAAARPRYGIDGYPYLVGLSAASAVLTAAALALVRRHPGWSALAALGAVGSAIPALLGARYVFLEKVAHRERLLDVVVWRGDEVVLDVGTGAGLLAVGAAKRVPRGRVLGVDVWSRTDLSGNGPARARRNAQLEGVSSRVEIRDGDARALGLPDASVDVVLSVLCLHNLDSGRERALAEMARVLRPGGTIVLSDLAGEDVDARSLDAAGLVVERRGRAPGTFPPQRVVVARRPGAAVDLAPTR